MTENTLSARLSRPPILIAPGVYDALTALIAVRAGFDALYVSGAGIAYSRLGRPDIGLVSLSEVVQTVALIRDRVGCHLIVDADTGYGNALNVQRTVRLLERVGANAIQIEDQDFPKRCGHLDDKTLVPTQEMAGKIKAAVDARTRRDTLIIARTDAVAGEGIDRAVARAALYREAGADMLFIEAPRLRDQLGSHRCAAQQIRPADGQHGGRRQDADAAGARTGGARLRAGDFPWRCGAHAGQSRRGFLHLAEDPRQH